jgi:ABC-type multidrug transport system ATPase subunit
VSTVADATDVLARASAVTRRFGSQVAVDRVSLEVPRGSIVGLLGANGAGKTTLIRMLLGLLRPTDGNVSLFDAPPSRQGRTRLGYVPQGLGLYGDLTVRENAEFVANAFGVAVPSLPTDLAANGDRLVAEIGLGRQRQLAFAAALAHEPELVVLDEPTSGVDPLARARLWDLIHEQAERGAAVLVTTHYMQEAQQCDRLSIMASGRVVAEGTADSIVGDATAVLVQSDRWEDAFNALSDAGEPVTLDGRRVRVAGTAPEQVRRILGDSGVAADIHVGRATLEEIMVTISRDQ